MTDRNTIYNEYITPIIDSIGYRYLITRDDGTRETLDNMYYRVANAVAKGVVVALASQCILGRVNMNVYDTGRDLLSFGVVPLDDMFPETGLVKLMWVLGQTSNTQKAIKLLKTDIAGEFSPRTLPQEKIVEGGQ